MRKFTTKINESESSMTFDDMLLELQGSGFIIQELKPGLVYEATRSSLTIKIEWDGQREETVKVQSSQEDMTTEWHQMSIDNIVLYLDGLEDDTTDNETISEQAKDRITLKQGEVYLISKGSIEAYHTYIGFRKDMHEFDNSGTVIKLRPEEITPATVILEHRTVAAFLSEQGYSHMQTSSMTTNNKHKNMKSLSQRLNESLGSANSSFMLKRKATVQEIIELAGSFTNDDISNIAKETEDPMEAAQRVLAWLDNQQCLAFGQMLKSFRFDNVRDMVGVRATGKVALLLEGLNEAMTINIKKLTSIAKEAGETNPKSKKELNGLAIKYGNKVPATEVIKILKSYDMSELMASVNENK